MSHLIPSAVSTACPSIVMTTASAPSVMMATAAASHMPVPMTAFDEDDAVTAAQRSRMRNWHCGYRYGSHRDNHASCQADQK